MMTFRVSILVLIKNKKIKKSFNTNEESPKFHFSKFCKVVNP